MRFFVFVDTEYYPYVGDPVEAETAREALRLAVANESLQIGDDIYVAPMDFVAGGSMQGARAEPQGLLKLMEESNRLRAEQIAGMTAVYAEPGTSRPGLQSGHTGGEDGSA